MKYFTFDSDWSLDLAFQNNLIWRFVNGYPGSSLQGVYPHNWIILFFISPLYILWPHPETLLLVKSAAFALTAFPLYGLAAKLTKSGPARHMIILGFFLNGGVLKIVLNDFFPISIALPLLVLALYHFHERNRVGFIICSILALFCREEIIAALLFFSAYGLLNKKRYKADFLLPAGVILFYLATYRLLPFSTQEFYYPAGFYADTLARLPASFANIISWDNLFFIVGLLIPLGFAMLSEPIYTGITILYLAVFSSSVLLQTDLGFAVQVTHITVPIVFVIIASQTFGIGRIGQKAWDSRFWRIFIIALLVLSTIYTLQKYYDLTPEKDYNTGGIWELLTSIPADASVAVSRGLAAPLSSRQNISTIENAENSDIALKADYLIVDEASYGQEIPGIYQAAGKSGDVTLFRNSNSKG